MSSVSPSFLIGELWMLTSETLLVTPSKRLSLRIPARPIMAQVVFSHLPPPSRWGGLGFPVCLSRRGLLCVQSVDLEPLCSVSAVGGQDAILRAPCSRDRTGPGERKPVPFLPWLPSHFGLSLSILLCASRVAGHACWDKHRLQCFRPYLHRAFQF